MEGLTEAVKLAPVLGPWLGIAALIGMLLRSVKPYVELRRQGAESEAARSAARITSLEERLEQHQRQATEERQRLEDKIETQRIRYEAVIESDRVQHEASMSVMRHRLNNSDQSIEALLLILDDDDLPERIKGKVARIRELRARQKEAEERERDAIRAALVTAKAVPPQPSAATPTPIAPS